MRLQRHTWENIRWFDTFPIQEKRDTEKTSIPLVVYIGFVRYSTAQTACWLCFLALTESETLIHDISEWGKFILALRAVHAVIDRDKPYIVLGKDIVTIMYKGTKSVLKYNQNFHSIFTLSLVARMRVMRYTILFPAF